MIFVDSNIPMYAAGKPSEFKEACIQFLLKIEQLKVQAASSVEVLQEILHRFYALRRLQEGVEVYQRFRALPLHFFEIKVEDLDEAKEILISSHHLSSRDAIHLAVMRRNKINKIVTYDRGFLNVKALKVLLPHQV
ncbi:MAG: type II toxin-antitoxin system VapC family toxin [Deltaproteobacteria bacterium]|nr:type II toxin-antitoxin system VapC family toxin [Deltaproteobacteria bacterium]